jgi:hypothetical protein
MAEKAKDERAFLPSTGAWAIAKDQRDSITHPAKNT